MKNFKFRYGMSSPNEVEVVECIAWLKCNIGNSDVLFRLKCNVGNSDVLFLHLNKYMGSWQMEVGGVCLDF